MLEDGVVHGGEVRVAFRARTDLRARVRSDALGGIVDIAADGSTVAGGVDPPWGRTVAAILSVLARRQRLGDRIIKHGHMVRGWLGASLLPLSDAARSHLGLDAGVGAEVTRVERESPARKAGLAARDILLSFDGKSVSDLDALQWKIAAVEEPTKVRIVFLHNGETKTVDTQIELDPQK